MAIYYIFILYIFITKLILNLYLIFNFKKMYKQKKKTKKMNEIFEYFKSYGIDIGEILKSYGLVFNESSSPIIGFIFIIFILASIAILCFINIAIYFGVIFYF